MRVVSYRIHWDVTKNNGGVDLQLEDGSTVTLTSEEPGKLIIWIDLLRNDMPVTYWRTGTAEGLASEWEHTLHNDDHEDERFKHDGQG